MAVKPLNQGGYTLAEVVVTAAIIGIMASIGPKIFVNITQFFRMSMARYELQRDSKNAITTINRNLRQAKSTSVTITQVSGQPYYSRINFNKYLTDSTVRAMSFYQQDDKLYMVDNGSTHTVCQNLRYVAFSYPKTENDDIISVSMTLEKATYGGQTKALQLAVEKVRVMN